MGKLVFEDFGIGNGRTRDWPAIPAGLYTEVPSWGSTTVVCSQCGSPFDGLVYDPDTETFQHRLERDCHPFL